VINWWWKSNEFGIRDLRALIWVQLWKRMWGVVRVIVRFGGFLGGVFVQLAGVRCLGLVFVVIHDGG